FPARGAARNRGHPEGRRVPSMDPRPPLRPKDKPLRSCASAACGHHHRSEGAGMFRRCCPPATPACPSFGRRFLKPHKLLLRDVLLPATPLTNDGLHAAPRASWRHLTTHPQMATPSGSRTDSTTALRCSRDGPAE